MRVLKYSSEAIKEAASIIKEGGLVAFPTETVYGLGASALNPEAIARVFEVKRRPHFEPLIVHIADMMDLERLCLRVDDRAKKLIKEFWPGPLTLVLPKSDILPDIVTAGLRTVAIRMPSHPVALELIREAGVPVAAPSANPSGYLSPTEASHVMEQIGPEIDLIINGGKCPLGLESTVLDISEEPTLLRAGAVPIERIKEVIGEVKISSPLKEKRRYSLRKPLKILKNGEAGSPPEGMKVGLLAFKPPADSTPFEMVEVLSLSGDLREAAANLFSSLHRLDKAEIDLIYAEPIPETGLGRAIMERLRRAEDKK
ncbi:MAG: threonylcarbamoyl-AMP synthase [Candidatus Syntrophoarchaeum sp. WYZ-LMO15]|nr:MAG: threonylcarbamoyl-AMP synthase [Candidatus Syntrophoarchaeum sp. WYZ-LMO15]